MSVNEPPTERERKKISGQLYGYDCPECGAHNSTPDGYIYEGLVIVKCGACNHVERFPWGYLSNDNRQDGGA